MLWLFVTLRTQGVCKLFSLFTPESTHITAWSTIGRPCILDGCKSKVLASQDNVTLTARVYYSGCVLHYLNRCVHKKGQEQGLNPWVHSDTSNPEQCRGVQDWLVTNMDSETVGNSSCTVLFNTQASVRLFTYVFMPSCDWLFPLFIKQCFRPENYLNTSTQCIWIMFNEHVSLYRSAFIDVVSKLFE